MSDRKEPTISSYTPSAEDSARQKAQAQSAPHDAKKNSETPPPRNPHPSSVPVQEIQRVAPAKSLVAVLAFLLALASSGAAGYLYWQLMEAQKLLVNADTRLQELESKFAMTDDQITASAETIQAKLVWADAEIRKLWGVAYDSNRKAIAENTQEIDKIKKTITEIEKLKQAIDTAKKDVDKIVKAATSGLAADVKLLNDLVEAQQSSFASIEQNNTQFMSNLKSAQDKLSQLESGNREIERRIKNTEQSIEAIDAFRRNVNQQLLQLRGSSATGG